MQTGEHKGTAFENLSGRIDLSLSKAQAKTRALNKSYNWLIWASFVATALSTFIAFAAAVLGQKALMGLLGIQAQADSNDNWKIICGIVGGLNVLAVFLTNSMKTFLISDKLSKAVAVEGSLAALQERLKYFDEPEDVAKEYFQVIQKDADLVREQS